MMINIIVIVIAVIAILSAVLIPTFGSVVANAEEAALKADAKAIYTEYVAWASENGEDVAEEVKILIDEYYYDVKNGIVVDQKPANGTADGKITEADGSKDAPAAASWKQVITKDANKDGLVDEGDETLPVWVPAA